jgi:hypothetical protein
MNSAGVKKRYIRGISRRIVETLRGGAARGGAGSPQMYQVLFIGFPGPLTLSLLIHTSA